MCGEEQLTYVERTSGKCTDVAGGSSIGTEEECEEAAGLIEWSEKGLGLLPKPDLEIEMRVIGDTSRRLFVQSGSDKGERALARLPA